MSQSNTRRDFLKTSSVAAAVTVAGTLSIGRSAHAAGNETLRVGLIGCGGRGSGAAANALNADPNTKLVALADAFPDRLKGSLSGLKRALGDRVTATPETCFAGLDSYQKLIDCGVDVVLLCSPPHFRPMHLKAAIDAGKHVFCEKPVAVDAPGVRSILASSEAATRKNLAIVSGLCWRYDYGVRETMKRVLDGAIGDILAIQETYLTGTLWHHGRQPSWTEMEYQLRNWLYFTWLSGDHNNEQHVHSLDKMGWAMRDEPPVRAWGVGGRQVRTDPKFGDIFDHHAVCYEYANGVRGYAFCRQTAGCYSDTSDIFIGTKGKANILGNTIEGQTKWRYEGPKPSMYDVEHVELFKSIRDGKPINNGVYMARSTMLAVLGRMVTHSGRAITWDEAMKSELSLAPAKYALDADPPVLPDKDGKYAISVPGVSKVL